MFGKAPSDDFSAGNVQCGKEGRSAVTKVVGSSAFDLPWLHRQDWLGAAQSLNLAFLIHTKHQSIGRRAQVKPDNVTNLLHQQRILRKNEALAAVGLQTKRPPDPADARLTQAKLFSHQTRAPMSSALGRRFQGPGDDFFNAFVADFARRSRPRFIEQPLDAALEEASTPHSDRIVGSAQKSGYLRIRFGFGTVENDLRAKSYTARPAFEFGESVEFLYFCDRQTHALSRASCHAAEDRGSRDILQHISDSGD